MSSIQLQNLHKNFGRVPVLRGIDLHIQDGEFVCFVGPSGCGKSTLLRLIAGLEAVGSGKIFFDEQDLTQASAKARRVAMVFQSYALYPHMSVQDNLSFGMRMRGVPAAQITEKLQRAVQMLQLQPYLQRKPGELSGGQCQRVAIGRAIVQEPGAFLFDEPLSNLDAELRLHMRLEIARLHQTLGTTMVYVTHDQVEAMTLAQRIVVLRDGAVAQVGTPMDLYTNPKDRFVAGFIGAPAMNLLPAQFDGSRAQLADGLHVELDLAPAAQTPHTQGHIGVRPEHLQLVAADAPGWPLRVAFVERLGASCLVHGSVGNAPVVAESRLPVWTRAGETLRVQPQPGTLYAFDAQGRTISRDKAVAGAVPLA